MRAVLLTATLLAALLAVAVPVAAQGPVASFTFTPATPGPGEPVTFTSTSQPGASALVAWEWDFGDGATATGETVQHVFAAGQSFVTLIVADADGQTAMFSADVTIAVPSEAGDGAVLPSWIFWLMPFLVSLILFAMAYLVVAKGQPAIYNQVFMLFYVTSGLKSLSESAIALLVDHPAVPGLEVFNRVTAYLLLALFLWFVLVFPRPIADWLRDGRRGSVALVLVLPFLAIDLGALLPTAFTVNAFNVVASIVAVASLALLWAHSRVTDSQEERSRIRWLAFTFLLLVASTLAVAVLHLSAPEATLTLVTGLVLVPALEIVGAVILLYAILRYQVLGIEGLVLRITRGAVTALTVPSLFIVIGNSVEAVFEATVLAGVEFSFIIAGFLSALLLIPVQKWITFLIHRFLPSLDQEPAQEAARRREIFEAQLRYCLLDGALKDGEVGLLRRLARQLAMPDAELRAILARFKGADLGTLVALQAGSPTQALPPPPSNVRVVPGAGEDASGPHLKKRTASGRSRP